MPPMLGGYTLDHETDCEPSGTLSPVMHSLGRGNAQSGAAKDRSSPPPPPELGGCTLAFAAQESI